MRRCSVVQVGPVFERFLLASVGCLACSGEVDRRAPLSEPDPMNGTVVPGETPDPVEPPNPVAVQGDCLEVRSYPDEQTAAVRTGGTWSSRDRILTQVSSSDGTDAVGTLKWRFRTDGQIIAYVGVEEPFRHDYEYDEHGNQIDFYLSYPGVPDLMSPSTASRLVGRSHANEYDAAGRLTASTANDYGDGGPGLMFRSTFMEDSEGRCAQVDSGETGREVRMYDEAGRLARIERTDQRGSTFVDETTYDDQDRLLVHTSIWNGAPGIRSGTVTTTHSYLDDGSEVVEVVDGLTDTGGGHTITTRSATCLAIDAAIGHPADARCRVE
jgi:YD repeat-containing protein